MTATAFAKRPLNRMPDETRLALLDLPLLGADGHHILAAPGA